jgi:hypothetical protein
MDTLSIPTVPAGKAEEETSIIFDSPSQMIRDPNEEFPGGAIAMVVSNDLPVDAPPNTLARMHACRQKQVAFNKSILRNEVNIATMNADISHFLRGFDPNPEKTMHVAHGIGSRARGAQPIYGQLWEQDGRRMTATSSPPRECGTTKEAITLSGVEDALRWRHVLEMSPNPRPGLRMNE